MKRSISWVFIHLSDDNWLPYVKRVTFCSWWAKQPIWRGLVSDGTTHERCDSWKPRFCGRVFVTKKRWEMNPMVPRFWTQSCFFLKRRSVGGRDAHDEPERRFASDCHMLFYPAILSSKRGSLGASEEVPGSTSGSSILTPSSRHSQFFPSFFDSMRS